MPPNHPKPPVPRRRSEIVCVVDDFEPLRHTLLRLLSNALIQARGFPSALHALRFLEHHEAAVVVSDYSMAGPDGGRLLALVRDRWPLSRRVLLTGNPWALSVEAREAAHRIVGKGAAVDETLDAIRAEIEEWRRAG
jgi:FixJ family two-component response regulator